MIEHGLASSCAAQAKAICATISPPEGKRQTERTWTKEKEEEDVCGARIRQQKTWGGSQTSRTRWSSQEMTKTCKKCKYKCLLLIGILGVLLVEFVYRVANDILKGEHLDLMSERVVKWLNDRLIAREYKNVSADPEQREI